MADFTVDMDMDKLFPKGLRESGNKKLAFEMIDAAQEVMLKAIQEGAKKHVVTGDMARSLKKTRKAINKDGDAVGRIRFTGSSGMSKSKSGRKFDRTNWIKAFRIEYGTKKQRAQPFVRPAIKRSEAAAMAAMQKVFNEKTKL